MVSDLSGLSKWERRQEIEGGLVPMNAIMNWHCALPHLPNPEPSPLPFEMECFLVEHFLILAECVLAKTAF